MKERRNFSPLILQILAPWDVQKVGETAYRSACPVHGGTNATTFSIFANGSWRCFKCGASGDMARLLVHVQKITLSQAIEMLGGASLPVFHDMALMPEMPTWEERKSKEPYALLPEAILGPYRSHCPRYLLDRGFSQESLRRYEIGYDVQNSKIILPIRDYRGKLTGLTYRVDFDDDRTQMAKYWHDNFSKSLHLYGFHLWAKKPGKRLFLVEGQLDAVRMSQLGFRAVAIMGSDLSDAQRDLIVKHAKAEQVVLAFDNDEAGEGARRSAIRKLCATSFGSNLVSLHYPGKDPGELKTSEGLRLVPWYEFVMQPWQKGTHSSVQTH